MMIMFRSMRAQPMMIDVCCARAPGGGTKMGCRASMRITRPFWPASGSPPAGLA